KRPTFAIMLQSIGKYVKKQGAVLALLLFTVHLLPQELLHSFFPHNDTEDCVIDNSRVAVGNPHVHCDFSQLEGIAITADEVVCIPVIVSYSFAHPQCKLAPAVVEQPSSLFLRGPPENIG
ncbi:MAG: hypothetical protein ACRC3B_23155, partial [Bacteroidia bacterium]